MHDSAVLLVTSREETTKHSVIADSEMEEGNPLKTGVDLPFDFFY